MTMTKIRSATLSALIATVAVFAPAPARAVECDQLSTGMRLCLPRYGTDGDQWGTALINALTLVNSSGVYNSTSAAATIGTLWVGRIGGIPTSDGVRISSAMFQDSGFYFLTNSSASFRGAGGVGILYGWTSATGTTSSWLRVGDYLVTAGSAAVQGAGGMGATYGIVGGSVTSSSFVQIGSYLRVIGSGTVEGASGLGVIYGVVVGSMTALYYSSAPFHYAGDGHAGAPAIARAANTASGMFFNGNDISFSVNGTTRATVGLSTGLCGGTGQTTGQPCIRSSGTGTASDPQFQFANDGNTGMLRPAADQLQFTAGGTVIASMTATEFHAAPGTVLASSFAAGGYSLMTSSGVYIKKGPLYLDAGSFVRWPDGTTSTTSASGASAGVKASTWVYLNGGIFTQSAFGSCLSGSTVTVTTGGSADIEVWFNGTVSNNSTQESALSFLMDGAFLSPMTASIAAAAPSPLSSQCQNAFFKIRFVAPSGGSHSFCLTGRTQGGVNYTVTGKTTVCPYASQNNTLSQFGVTEL